MKRQHDDAPVNSDFEGPSKKRKLETLSFKTSSLPHPEMLYSLLIETKALRLRLEYDQVWNDAAWGYFSETFTTSRISSCCFEIQIDDFSGDDFTKIIAFLKKNPSLIEFYFPLCSFHLFPELELTKIFRALDFISQLDLSCNNLSELSVKQINAVFSGLSHAKVDFLCLQSISLKEFTSNQWEAFCNGLSQTDIIELDLSFNRINKLTANQLQALFTELQKTKVQLLNLESNSLNKLSDQQWTVFCQGLAQTKILGLRAIEENILTETKIEQIEKILRNNREARI